MTYRPTNWVADPDPVPDPVTPLTAADIIDGLARAYDIVKPEPGMSGPYGGHIGGPSRERAASAIQNALEYLAHPSDAAHDFEPLRHEGDTTCSRCLSAHPSDAAGEGPDVERLRAMGVTTVTLTLDEYAARATRDGTALDVERLTRIVAGWDRARRPAAYRSHSWGYYRDVAGYIQREYARLSEPTDPA